MKERKEGKDVTVTWNRFARLLVRLEKAWKEHQEVWLGMTSVEREQAPEEFHKFLVRNFNRSKFDVMLPRLIEYCRRYGGIEALVVERKKVIEKDRKGE